MASQRDDWEGMPPTRPRWLWWGGWSSLTVLRTQGSLLACSEFHLLWVWVKHLSISCGCAWFLRYFSYLCTANKSLPLGLACRKSSFVVTTRCKQKENANSMTSPMGRGHPSPKQRSARCLISKTAPTSKESYFRNIFFLVLKKKPSTFTWKIPSSVGLSESHSGESRNWRGKI